MPEIVDKLLEEFEYDKSIALRWHVAGVGEPIIIDPRVSFGAPNVKGVPTWIVKERWQAGEKLQEIADDFRLTEPLVKDALRFEGIEGGRKSEWVH